VIAISFAITTKEIMGSDEMSCKYCEQPRDSNEVMIGKRLDNDLGVIDACIVLNPNNGIYLFMEVKGDTDYIDINYCPMCGRKLIEDNIPYKEVVDYLNKKTGRNFKHTTKSTQTCIRARFNDGFELDDFKKVVDKKSKDWLGSKYEKYLRPETLFKSKFDSYLQDAKASESEVDWEDLV